MQTAALDDTVQRDIAATTNHHPGTSPTSFDMSEHGAYAADDSGQPSAPVAHVDAAGQSPASTTAALVPHSGSTPSGLNTAPTLTIPANVYGPSLTILRDPTRSRTLSTAAAHPPGTRPPSPPPLSSFHPLPVSLPRLPPIPPLVVHQEQLYFDDGLGAPGRCPHDRVWGGINDHLPERGRNLSDVEMDDFMVDLGELISKEYDAWIERCWVESFHHIYTTLLPSLLISLVQLGCSTTFLRRSIIYGGPHIDALLANHFAHLMRDEHERRMADEGMGEGRRGADWANLLAGIREVGSGVYPGAGGGAARPAAPAPMATADAATAAPVQDPILQAAITPGTAATASDLLHQQIPLAQPFPLPVPVAHGVNGAAPPKSSSPANMAPSGPPLAGQQLPMPSSPKTDPARTGYGNGICFHDLALLHGRTSAVSQPVNPLTLQAGQGQQAQITAGLDAESSVQQVLPAGPTGATSPPPAPPLPKGVTPIWTAGDDHGPCMCHLTCCRTCFHELLYFRGRRVELAPNNGTMTDSATGGQQQGGPAQQIHKRPSPLQIRHPEMADVLFVEEHIRTRLHYMASEDVVLRYGTDGAFNRFGVGTGAGLGAQPAAPGQDDEQLAGDLESTQDEYLPWDDATFMPRLEEVLVQNGHPAGQNGAPPKPKEVTGKNGQVKLLSAKKTKGGKAKGGKAELQRHLQMNGGGPPPAEKEDAAPPAWEKRWNGRQLPNSWLEEPASARNMACILLYRHFVKILHQTAMSMSPFDFPEYADDSAVLTEIHPLAVYRRLVEPYVRRNAPISGVDVDKWKKCMTEWEKEVAVREKEGGNAILKTQPARAVAFYTQAICLDSENPVYYLNRAAAFNAIENYEDAELDCSRALGLNKTHMKAWYRRAVARKGMGRLDEAEQDLLHLLNQAPNIAAATAELAAIRKEIEEMKKRDEVDDLD